ncbi:hypothetical protein ENBRE01_3141 [Enteropsectra breve]|nr:hypothetical protein ENBRE01_3110 [Enteropsectra breve]KAI5153178.1 hypothetical protein ENBRE01_3141 [Enteropsectra breve]
MQVAVFNLALALIAHTMCMADDVNPELTAPNHQNSIEQQDSLPSFQLTPEQEEDSDYEAIAKDLTEMEEAYIALTKNIKDTLEAYDKPNKEKMLADIEIKINAFLNSKPKNTRMLGNKKVFMMKNEVHKLYLKMIEGCREALRTTKTVHSIFLGVFYDPSLISCDEYKTYLESCKKEFSRMVKQSEAWLKDIQESKHLDDLDKLLLQVSNHQGNQPVQEDLCG